MNDHKTLRYQGIKHKTIDAETHISLNIQTHACCHPHFNKVCGYINKICGGALTIIHKLWNVLQNKNNNMQL